MFAKPRTVILNRKLLLSLFAIREAVDANKGYHERGAR